MVTDQQVRRLMSLINKERSLASAAAKAGMDEKTARKYRRLGKLPSESRRRHRWRTRKDPFEAVWAEILEKLEINPGLEAKTLFEYLLRRHPGRFGEGQLRTLQRRIKRWRALAGPAKEVFFPQTHRPGELCQSDFTWMTELGVTIAGQPFDHLFYHFTLTYSNWETGRVCVSESFESVSDGLQAALWELGGVPGTHRTDRMSTAIKQTRDPDAFTDRYRALLRHYGLQGTKTNAASPHENGDIEGRHNWFKRAVDQALMLRGFRDFESRAAYEQFLRGVLGDLNRPRRERFDEELRALRRLPATGLSSCKRQRARVRSSSTIVVDRNIYSVDSRLIGEMVEVRLYAERLELWYGQQRIETMGRLRGRGKHRVHYRHIIDWLIRKPGAFENYLYRDDLFPTSRFRMAYDWLRLHHPQGAIREYLAILELAARESETAVDEALRCLITSGREIRFTAIEGDLRSQSRPQGVSDVVIDAVDLGVYDALLGEVSL